MADRPTIKTVSAGAQYDTDTLNENFIKLRDAFDNLVARQGTGGSNNTFGGDLDMGGHVIRNATSIDIVSGITETVNSISALRLLTLDNVVDTVIVKGNTTAGDGGGGVYIYDSSDTTSTDNNGTIIVDAAGRRWKLITADEITPEMFGAKGNDAAADTTAIRTALAALPSGGTLRLKDGRTYYCQASATALEAHWNNVPQIYVDDNSNFTLGEIITGGTSGTTAVIVGIDVNGTTLGLRDVVGTGFVNGETVTGNVAGSATCTANIQGGPFFTTHPAFELTKPVKIEGRATLKLIGTGNSNELPYIFANSKDTPINNLRFRDFTIDLDIDGNAGSGQPRGMCLVSCDNLEIDSTVTIMSSNSKGGYAIDLFDCLKPRVSASIENVSGGVFCAYCKGVILDLICDGFNEAIDIDKPCEDVKISGVYRNGTVGSGQFFDVNASNNVVIDSAFCNTGGIVLFYNGKKNIAATWEDHINGINYGFVGADGCTVTDNCEFTNCNNTVNTASMTIGNNWAGNPHPNVPPPGRIYIGGRWTNCSFLNINESAGITLNCQLTNINSPAAPSNTGAVRAISEIDFSTYPDAEQWSDLKIYFGPNFSVDGCTRSAIDINGASEIGIKNIRVRNPATGGDTTDRAIHVRSPDVRNTKGIISGNDVDCNNACQGIGFIGDGSGTPNIAVGDNNITNWHTYPYRLSGTNVRNGIRGKKVIQRLVVTTSDQPTAEIPLLTAPPGTGYYVIAAFWTDEIGLAADNTNFSALRVRHLDTAGSNATSLCIVSNQSTTFTKNVPLDMGDVPSPDNIIMPGETLTLVINIPSGGGTGANFQGTITVHYLEWCE